MKQNNTTSRNKYLTAAVIALWIFVSGVITIVNLTSYPVNVAPLSPSFTTTQISDSTLRPAVKECAPLKDTWHRPQPLQRDNMPNLHGRSILNISGVHHIKSFAPSDKRPSIFAEHPLIERESKDLICSHQNFLTDWRFLCTHEGRYASTSDYSSSVELLTAECAYVDYGSRTRDAVGTVYADYGWIHTKDDVVLHDDDYIIEIDELAVIGMTSYPEAFGHWPTQLLPKLIVLWNEVPVGVPILLYSIMKPWLQIIFNAGLLDRRLHPILFHGGPAAPGLTYRASRMWFLTNFDYTPRTMGLVTPYLWRKMRQTFYERLFSKVVPKETILIINRNADAGSRGWSNYAEMVEAIRAEYGKDFEIVEFIGRGKTFFEAGRIFVDARMVIATHGAGLSYQIFMREGTGVVEISVLDHSFQPPPMYHEIAKGLGLKYGMAMYPGNAYSGNITPDIDEVIRVSRKVMKEMEGTYKKPKKM